MNRLRVEPIFLLVKVAGSVEYDVLWPDADTDPKPLFRKLLEEVICDRVHLRGETSQLPRVARKCRGRLREFFSFHVPDNHALSFQPGKKCDALIGILP